MKFCQTRGRGKNKIILQSVNPISYRGENCNFDSWIKLYWAEKLLLFLIHYKVAENKKFVFTVIMVDLEGTGIKRPPAPTAYGSGCIWEGKAGKVNLLKTKFMSLMVQNICFLEKKVII